MGTYYWLVYGLQLDFLYFVYIHFYIDHCYYVLFVVNFQSKIINTLLFTRKLEITLTQLI